MNNKKNTKPQNASERSDAKPRASFVPKSSSACESREQFALWLDFELVKLEQDFAGFSTATSQWRKTARL